MRPETSGVPLRAFSPSDVKRVARSQLDARLVPKGFRLLQAEPVVHASRFAAFQSCLAEQRQASSADEQLVRQELGRSPPITQEMLSPTLALHAAPSASNLDGILADGLLAPGELANQSGKTVPMSHGARYGAGRYLTQDLELARSYGGGPDADGRERVLLCLVAPGHCEILVDEAASMLRPDDWYHARCRSCSLPLCDGWLCRIDELKRGLALCRCRQELGAPPPIASQSKLPPLNQIEQMSQVEKLTRGQLDELAARFEASIERLELEAKPQAKACNFASRISPDQKQIVFAKAEQVLPLLLVTYEPITNFSRAHSAVSFALQPWMGAAGGSSCLFYPLDNEAVAVALAAAATAAKAAKATPIKPLAPRGVRFQRALIRAAEERRLALAVRAEAELATVAASAPRLTLQMPRIEPLLPGETSSVLRICASCVPSHPIHVTVRCSDETVAVASPLTVTLSPPSLALAQRRMGASGATTDQRDDDEVAMRTTPPTAEFKLTVLRASFESVTVHYELSGEGAREVTAPPASATLTVRSENWAATLPQSVLVERSQAQSSVHLSLLVYTSPKTSLEKSSAFAAAAHIAREIQPQTCTAILASPTAPPTLLSKHAPPEKAMDALKRAAQTPSTAGGGAVVLPSGVVADSQGGLASGVSMSIDLALRRLAGDREERLLRVHADAERAVWSVPLPEWRQQQESEPFARSVVLAMVEKAMELGMAGQAARQRRVEKAARRARADLDRREDSLTLLTIIDLGGGGGSADAEASHQMALDAKSIAGAQLQLAVRVLGVGPWFDPTVALKAKATLQTVHAYEPQLLYRAETRATLQQTTRALCRDAVRTTLASPVTLVVPHAERRLHCGIVAELGASPKWSMPLRVGGEATVVLLFQGAPPRTLLLNGSPIRVALQAPHPRDHTLDEGAAARWLRCAAFTQPSLLVELLRLLQSLVSTLRVDAASKRRDVRWGIRWLRDLAQVLVEPPIEDGGGNVHSAAASVHSHSEVVRMLRTRRRLSTDLMQLLNDVEDTRLFAAAAAASSGLVAAPFLARPSQLKYGGKALRRVAKAKGGELTVPLLGVLRWLARMAEQTQLPSGQPQPGQPPQPGHEKAAQRALELGAEASAFAAAALRRIPSAARTLLAPASCAQHTPPLASLSDRPSSLHTGKGERACPSSSVPLLYSIGMLGVQLRLGRSEASAINPWAIRVEYFARARRDTATALCALDAGHRLKDGTGEDAPDVLLILDPALGTAANVAAHAFMRSALHGLYLSIAFTRTAALRLPSQHSALLVVAFAKACEQVLRRRGGEQLAEPRLSRQPSSFGLIGCSEDLRLALAILHTLRTLGACLSQPPVHLSAEIASKLLGPNPAACMTEAGDESVDTVCQLLVLLCLSPDLDTLFEEGHQAQLSNVAFGLLAEAVSRSCRVLLKATPLPPDTLEVTSGQSATMRVARHLARKALGIQAASCHDVLSDEEPEPPSLEHDGAFSLQAALQASGGFFLKAWTNATPFAVVACLGVASVARAWCKRHAANHGAGAFTDGATAGEPRALPPSSIAAVLSDAEASAALATELASAFESKAIGMRSFIQTHLPSTDLQGAQRVQCALYVQGLLFHSASSRRGGLPPLSDSEALLAQLASEERKEVYRARLQQKSARLVAALAASRRGARRHLAMVAKVEFMSSHGGSPKLFDHAELAALNTERAADDQLELAHGSPGLLLHHCCFPQCPMYLRDCRLPADRAVEQAADKSSGIRRNRGIYQHLKLFLTPERTYINAFHANALTLLGRRPNIGIEEYLQHLNKQMQFREPHGAKASGRSCSEVEAILVDVHAQFSSRRR